ncbi:hypothetical protein BDQ12DRAFT_683957 [Crucibulum laeve]|uniref:Uncharacterized protein n=1 Tax=Crucibulum laeve TaxID=68775 RepID=A0A5C3LXW8_9AGAR|nr:hypothetical protein BDQ12DRAFT_683957 [Crucibulum laeve]
MQTLSCPTPLADNRFSQLIELRKFYILSWTTHKYPGLLRSVSLKSYQFAQHTSFPPASRA